MEKAISMNTILRIAVEKLVCQMKKLKNINLKQNLKFIPESKDMPLVFGMLLMTIGVFLIKKGTHTKESVSGYIILNFLFLLQSMNKNNWYKKNKWLYFILQGLIIFDTATFMQNGYIAIYVSLIPVLIIECMLTYRERIKIFLFVVGYYGVFTATTLIIGGWEEFKRYFVVLILISISLAYYYSVYYNQVRMKVKAQQVTRELEIANEKIEDYARNNEREKMARDLHDTLSQGLSALVMQLDAVNVNLDKGNTKRAQEIISQAMDYTRKTLGESRELISSLRNENIKSKKLLAGLDTELEMFKKQFLGVIHTEISAEQNINETLYRNLIYIFRESLNNIIKHAKASEVWIRIYMENHYLYMIVKDNGNGFEVKWLDQLIGHYGLMGMRERIKSVDGRLNLISKKKQGTTIEVIVPVDKEMMI